MAEKILVIDDDESTVQLLSTLLRQRGFDVCQAYSAQDGLRTAYHHQPDLVLLDVLMSQMDGWEVCRRLREMSDVPIIFVSALGGAQDIVKGLEIGADDYVVKPVDEDELVARIKARLRRSPRPQMHEELIFNHGNFRINFMNRELWVRGKGIHLTPKEFNLLAVLARNAGRVVPRKELVAEAWGDAYISATDSLKLYIHYLRHKLESNPQQPEYILTSRGVGYRFVNR